MDSYLQMLHLPIKSWLGSDNEVLFSGDLLGVIGVSATIGGVEICFIAISFDTSVAVKVVSKVVSLILWTCASCLATSLGLDTYPHLRHFLMANCDTWECILF